MNPAPNPFGAPGPLIPRSEKKEPHHQPKPVTGIENPFAAVSSRSISSEGFDWTRIADQLPFGLVILGPHMELLHENETVRQWLGASIQDQGGIENWLASLCPEEEHRTRVLDSWRSHIWRNQLTRAFSLKGRDQKVREIEFRSTLQRDGGLTIVLQDISETFRAQELQRQSKLKFRSLFENMAQGVVLLDQEGKILEANPALLEIADRSLHDVRLIPFEELLQPSSLSSWRRWTDLAPQTIDLTVNTRKGPRNITVQRTSQVGESEFSPFTMLFVDPLPTEASQTSQREETTVLLDRLRTVARKTQSILDAVPDLILLLDRDLTIADFSAPKERWKVHHPKESWRGSAIEKVWPVLGQLISQSQARILEQGKTIQADMEARKDGACYSVTATNAGDDQILIVVRNRSELEHLRKLDQVRQSTLDALPDALLFFNSEGQVTGMNSAAERLLGEKESQLTHSSLLTRTGRNSVLELTRSSRWPFQDRSGIPRLLETKVFEAGAPGQYGAVLSLPASPPEPAEERQDDLLLKEQAEHRFRNQLQLATSLHQFEPVTQESQEASLRWQIRLRSLIASRPEHQSGPVSVSQLLHDVAGEVGSLSGRGPGSSCVTIEGSDHLLLSEESVTSLGLFIGEVLRIVLLGSDPAPGPDLSFRFLKDSRGLLQLQFETSPGRHKISEARAWEGEILEILASQMQGSLTGRPVMDNEEWTLCAAVLNATY